MRTKIILGAGKSQHNPAKVTSVNTSSEWIMEIKQMLFFVAIYLYLSDIYD
jgi:hypothetical protein